MDTVHQLFGRLRGARVAKSVCVPNVNALLGEEVSCAAEAKERGRKGKSGGEAGVNTSLDSTGSLLPLQSPGGRWFQELELTKNQQCFSWKSSLEGNRSEGRRRRREKSCCCCWPARVKRRGEGREERSRSPCSPVRGQNID